MKQRRIVPIVKPPEVNWENKLGTGRFGTVYLVAHPELDYEEVYAAKHCRFEREDAESTFKRELEILTACECPYIIKL